MDVRRLLCLAAPALLLLACGGSAPSAPTATPTPASIADLVAAVDQSRIEQDVRAIQGPRTSLDESIEHLREVRGFILDRLASLGYRPAMDPVTHENATFPVITADVAGSRCPDRVFVLGAHYDSVAGAPGADDNGSGVAAVLEAARLLVGQQPAATVRFAAFPFEEVTLGGSARMAIAARDDGVAVVGMVSADMLGFTGADSDFIFIAANEPSQPLLDAFLAARARFVPALAERHVVAPGSGESVPDLRRSDHAPFWNNGFRALLLTDTAALRNPNYHQLTDLADTLDFGFAADNTRLLVAGTLTYLETDAGRDGVPDVCQD